ncbi:MAG: hypothetical protein ACXIU8_10005 [Alkalilacustris sp.]
MTRAILLVALAITLHSAGWLQGRHAERAAWNARAAALTAERERASARIAGLSEALSRAEAAHAAMTRQLEEQAHADDDAGRTALPARSLHRLGAR